MKSILFGIIFFTGQKIHAQKMLQGLMADSAKLYVEYVDFRGYVNDSIYTELRRQPAFFGEKAAIYIHQTKTPEEFLKQQGKRADPRFMTPEQEINHWKTNYDVEKIVSTVWIRYYGAPDYLVIRKYMEGDVWSSDTFNYQWSLTKEFKTINGYRCQKATAINKQSEPVSVWFTEEIPISSGPYFLSGLPGLILEYDNPTGKRLIRATEITSTNIPRQFFRRWLKGPIVTKEEDREIYQGESEKAKRFLNMLKNNKDTSETPRNTN